MSAISQDGPGGPEIDLAPGTSPFCAKGSLWLGVQAYVDEHVEGGNTAFVRQLRPFLQEFLSQMFLAAAWFDVFPILGVSRALASMNRIPHMEQVRQMGAWHGEKDMNGMYKTLLKQASPQAVCRRFTSIYAQLYNFGRAEIVREESNRVEACAYGMPEPIATWWMNASESYLGPILKAAGAKNGKMNWQPLQPDGWHAGIALVRVPSATTWD
jgi:hypothetical protein